jgi:type I restriction enzyme R subunit
MDKKSLTERDICTKFILPAIKQAGWDTILQVREEVFFTKGRITVRGKLIAGGNAKKADFVLYYKPNIPIALIEAKDNNHLVGDGLQQGLDYAETLAIPLVFSSNGDGFVFHDHTGLSVLKDQNLSLHQFPTPDDLWKLYRCWKGLDAPAAELVLQDYYDDGSGKAPRYYEVNVVNAALEASAKGRDRVLLVMATGMGKTYTAFQIIWRRVYELMALCDQLAASLTTAMLPAASCSTPCWPKRSRGWMILLMIATKQQDGSFPHDRS